MRKVISLTVVLFSFHCAFGFTFTGTNPATAGQTYTYTFSDGIVYSSFTFYTSTGTGIVTNPVRTGTTYTCSIQWTGAGATTIIFSGFGTTKGTYNVTVNCPALTTPSATFSYPSGTTACGNVPISYTANPPLGVTWYWQTSSGGTLTTNATKNFTATASGTYYLRANCSGTWSTGALATSAVTVKTIPVATASPVTICSGLSPGIVVTNNMASTTVNWSVAFTSASGTPTSGSGVSGASSPYAYTIDQTLSATTNGNGLARYTITPVNNGCTGSSIQVDATIKPVPTVAASGQNVFSGAATSVSITNPNNVAGTTFTWTATQPPSVSGAVNGNGTTIAQTLTSSSTSNQTVTYRITPRASNCDGSYLDVPVIVYAPPIVTAPITGNTISMGAPVTLDAGAGYSAYAWKKTTDLGTTLGTTQAYNTLIAGYYVVTVSKSGVIGTATSLPFQVFTQFDAQNLNFIITNKLQVATSNASDISTLAVDFMAQTIEYFDGHGRPAQTVVTQGSPSRQDLVIPKYWDQFGRESRHYLPFVASEISGGFKAAVIDVNGNFANAALNFYNNSTDNIADDTRPFAENIPEYSDLNRPLQEYGPGQVWKDNSKYVAHAQLLNQDGTTAPLQEKIIAWIINGSGIPVRSTQSNLFVSAGFYLSGQLTIESTKDEDGKEVRNYIDKTGKTILKKVQATPTQAPYTPVPALTDANGWTQTYYVYDDFSLLRYVFQPELTKVLVGTGGDPAQADLDRFAFQYQYDGRNRIIKKRVPGADWVYMVYDNRDRLVLTQDGNQRNGTTKYWTFMKYDDLNRPVMTGIKDTTAALTQLQMQGVVDAYYLKTSARWGEAAGTVVHGYTSSSYPVLKDASKYLTVTYYDSYAFNNNENVYAYVPNDLTCQTVNGISYCQEPTNFSTPIGLVTGTKVKVLDTSPYWLKTVSYYDSKYRLIQSVTDHQRTGVQRTTNIFDFPGKVIQSKTTHIDMRLVWTDFVGARADGDKLISTTFNTNWGSNGAASVATLPAGTDGWVETSCMVGGAEMIGFSTTNADANYTTIKYAIAIFPSAYQVYQNSASPYVFPDMPAPGDVLRVERVGSTISYKLNGITRYTSTIPSTTQLVVDVAMYYSGQFMNTRTSFSSTSQSVTRTFDYDHAGRLINTWHSINGAPKVVLARNAYNRLGQLVDKSLHSSDNGVTFKQSVDYRYNIRGWMASMNNSRLTNDSGLTNDDSNDLFGMNLAYESTSVLGNMGNAAAYNGNISGMKWSANLGLGTIKEQGYKFTYDALNRLSAADSKQSSTAGSWNTGQFDENNLSYDLNGNILSLRRKGEGGVLIDDLTYNYGATKTNQLVYVQDNAAVANMAKGFTDGNTGTATDYTYDANGNMNHDLNKGIGTTTSDATSLITYNFLNLPETITKGGNLMRYTYDATGRKLTQTVTSSYAVKRTDYAGEFNFENDALQFFNTEEGRVVVATNTMTTSHDGSTMTNITNYGGGTGSQQTINGETYIRGYATVSGAFPGIQMIGGTVNVQAGDVYKVRVKGYSAVAHPVFIWLESNNNTNFVWPGAKLPTGAVAESWIEQIVAIPAGTTFIRVGLLFDASSSVGDSFYMNEFQLIKVSSGTPEYQYNLKDHLGNVRVTFTSLTTPKQFTAGFESANQATEAANFLNYNVGNINNVSINATTGTSSLLLNGAPGRQVGLAKSFSVMPGDVVSIQASAKFNSPTTTNSNLTGFAAALLSAFSLPTPVGGELNTASSAINAQGVAEQGGSGYGSPDFAHPRVFATILLFDRNYNYLSAAYSQLVSSGAAINVSYTATQPGYAYIYISNEQDKVTEVYFDDIAVTFTPSPVVQQQDYYPFGATFNSYGRENSAPNQYLYNGKELQDELSLNWLDYGARMYMPEIGRWGVVDPMCETSSGWSPYNYVLNNPLLLVDPDGMQTVNADGSFTYTDPTEIANVLAGLKKRFGGGDKKSKSEQGNNKEGSSVSGDQKNGFAILISFPDKTADIPNNGDISDKVASWFDDDDDGKLEVGHAGVIIVNPEAEGANTFYFDYGRYGAGATKGKGKVRSSKTFSGLSVPNWDNSKSVEENVNNILKRVASHRGKLKNGAPDIFYGYGRMVASVYGGLDFSAMYTYARGREAEGYTTFSCPLGNYCARFARQVVGAGGGWFGPHVFTGKQNVNSAGGKVYNFD